MPSSSKGTTKPPSRVFRSVLFFVVVRPCLLWLIIGDAFSQLGLAISDRGYTGSGIECFNGPRRFARRCALKPVHKVQHTLLSLEKYADSRAGWLH
jgi:hypothetical protein